MKIRKDLYDHYLQQDEEEFVDLIIEHLKTESPELVANLPDVSFREMIANGLAKARSYGLNIDEHLIGFVSIMFTIAPNFDENAEIHKVLTDQSIAVDDRFKALFEKTLDHAWEDAEANYETLAWYPELRKKEDVS